MNATRSARMAIVPGESSNMVDEGHAMVYQKRFRMVKAMSFKKGMKGGSAFSFPLRLLAFNFILFVRVYIMVNW